MDGEQPEPALVALRPDVPLGEAVTHLRRVFAVAGLVDAALDARVLVAHALGLPAIALVTGAERPLGSAFARLRDHARRRLAREPVARILGEKEFWGLPFRLAPETLVPRADTESVIETVLALRSDRARPRTVLDLGTGSGALLVALLTELPQATGLGVDIAPGAVRAARANARLNGVAARAAFAVGDWGDAAGGPFDLVVANPPYILSGDMAGLDPEVARFDPPAALDGGPDGLAAYRRILADLPRILAPDGLAVVEAGHDTLGPVASLVGSTGYRVARIGRDLGGHGRAVAFAR